MSRFALGVLLLAVLGCHDKATVTTEPALINPEANSNGQASPQALAVQSNTWITRADLAPIGRVLHAVAVVPNAAGQSILFVMGGRGATTGANLATVRAYNVATDKWSTKAPMPRVLFQTNGAVAINGKIYVSGGMRSETPTYSRALFMYDPAADTWSQRRDMPTRNYGGVTGAINGKLYVLTVCNTEPLCNPTTHSAFYRYDPDTDQWNSLPLPPRPHFLGVAGVINGKLYVTSGVEYNDFYTGDRDLDIYDPTSNRWTTGAPIPAARDLAAGVALGRKLYVIGGDFAGTLARTNYVYDPATNAWSLKAQLPTWVIGGVGGRVFVNGQPRIELVGGNAPNNLQYIP